MDKYKKCLLFDWCPSRTAICRTYLPDEECYWYRWFKKLIEEDKNPLKNINPKPIPTVMHKFKYKRK